MAEQQKQTEANPEKLSLPEQVERIRPYSRVPHPVFKQEELMTSTRDRLWIPINVRPYTQRDFPILKVKLVMNFQGPEIYDESVADPREYPLLNFTVEATAPVYADTTYAALANECVYLLKQSDKTDVIFEKLAKPFAVPGKQFLVRPVFAMFKYALVLVAPVCVGPPTVLIPSKHHWQMYSQRDYEVRTIYHDLQLCKTDAAEHGVPWDKGQDPSLTLYMFFVERKAMARIPPETRLGIADEAHQVQIRRPYMVEPVMSKEATGKSRSGRTKKELMAEYERLLQEYKDND